MSTSEIVTELQNINSNLYGSTSSWELQNLIDELRKSNLDLLDVNKQIQSELSGIDFNLSRIADVLEQLVPRDEAHDKEPKKEKGKWSWKVSSESTT